MYSKWYFTFIIGLLLLLGSCQRFDIVQCEMNVEHHPDSTWTVCNVRITDDGGFNYFSEKGYCVSFYNNPTILDVEAEVTRLGETGDEEREYSWKMRLTEHDTTYYIRAYIKNNAGLAYSNTVPVKN